MIKFELKKHTKNPIQCDRKNGKSDPNYFELCQNSISSALRNSTRRKFSRGLMTVVFKSFYPKSVKYIKLHQARCNFSENWVMQLDEATRLDDKLASRRKNPEPASSLRRFWLVGFWVCMRIHFY